MATPYYAEGYKERFHVPKINKQVLKYLFRVTLFVKIPRSNMPRIEDNEILRLSRRIKELRNKQGLTQSEVADRMDIDEGNYRKIENGMTNPTYLTLRRLSKALEIGLAEFFQEID